MPRDLTSSGFVLGYLCPASCALPAVFDPPTAESKRGDAVHRFIEVGLLHGESRAWEVVLDMIQKDPVIPEMEVRDICSGIDLGKLRGDCPSVSVEVAYAFDAENRASQVLGSQIGRAYGEPRDGVIPGTADIVWRWPDGRLAVGEVKTFDDGQEAEEHFQLGLHCLALARAYRAPRVTGRLIRATRDGVSVEETEYEIPELARWIDKARRAAQGVAHARAQVAAGIQPDTHPGSHCRGCKCLRAGCPAFAALPRMLSRVDVLPPVDALPDVVRERLAELSAADFGRAYETLTRMEKMTEIAREQMRIETAERVRRGEVIPLSGGMQLTMGEHVSSHIDTDDAYAVLLDEYGEEVVGRCVRWDITKGSIEQGLGATEGERALDLLKATGCFRRSVKPKFQPRKLREPDDPQGAKPRNKTRVRRKAPAPAE